MLVGYARVSTFEQNLDRQLDSLTSFGLDIRNIYQEKLSGTTKNRPALIKMIEELQPNDIGGMGSNGTKSRNFYPKFYQTTAHP